MPQFITLEAFRKEVAAKRKPDAAVQRLSTLPSMSVDGETRTRRFCFSDGTVDRMGDRINPDGWELGDFLANPVALWAHDSNAPPIGRAKNVGPENGRLMGDIEFIPPETYAFGDTIYRMYEGGYLRAVSVGFNPLEYSFVEDKNRPWGIDFKRQELLEISACPIPANPNALAEARAKGLDTRPMIRWAEQLLDTNGMLAVRRSTLIALQKQAKEPRSMPKKGLRLRADDPTMNGDDSAAGGALVGNCGRPADKECGMKDSAECTIHGFGGVSAGDSDDNDEKSARAVRLIIRSELRRAVGKRMRRRDAADGDPADDLPADHADTIRAADSCFRAAEDFYASGDDHHAEGLNLMAEAVENLDGDAPLPDDHVETVKAAGARFKSAEALYELGDQEHDKAMALLGNALDALTPNTAAPVPAAGEPDADDTIARALRRVKAARATA